MITRGYNKPLAAGSIVAAGTLGILIPPSIMLVVYAPQAGLSIGTDVYGCCFSWISIVCTLYCVYCY